LNPTPRSATLGKVVPQIVWHDSYCIGVKQLDMHHQHLVKLINQLAEQSTCSVYSEHIADTISELTQYAIYHFSYEEKLMSEHGFPRLPQHRVEHIQFCEVIAETSYGATLGIISISDLLEYLTRWLKKHILLEDMQIKPYLATLGVE
jgi:hemerythrin